MEQKSINTYKISFKKIHRAAAAEVRVHKKLSIITLVLYGVAMLLFIFDSEVYKLRDDIIPAVFVPSAWGVFFAVVGVIVGYFTALNIFRDMNNQQLCDVSMALPIKASERFFSKVLSLFYIQIFPLIVSTFVGNGIAILWGKVQFGSIDPEAAKTMFMIVLACLAGSMFIMAIAVLCACCCGALAESAYFSIILMGVLNALPMAYVYYVIAKSSGFTDMFYTLDRGFDLGYFGVLFLVTDFDKMIPHCLVSSVISLAIMLLSGFIYVKRDARTVGTPIASKLFFEIIMALSCATIFTAFSMSDYVFWGILISAVGYVIINIIVSRAKINVLSFLKWGAKYAATLAAFTVLLVITVKTGGFGHINSRPDAEYLDGAAFEIMYFDYNDYNSTTYGYHREELNTAVLTAEQADEVMSICKKYLVKGRADTNPFDIIFGKSYNVILRAESDEMFNPCPSPKDQFIRKSDENDNIGYTLNFRQYIHIPESDAKAMMAELSSLDYILKPAAPDQMVITPETQYN
ncbi:MAG: hypothetical protein HDT42_00515 [Ruminococcaceae bacterium]|nr:hypothetical protein [Oscillospiraceae bacterium]